jgi:hypothetical protein
MKKRTLQDHRPRDWWWLDNRTVDDLWMPFLGVHAWAVYCVLVRHADGRGRAMPSLKEISGQSGVSLAEVKRSLKVLFAAKLVRKARVGGGTGTTVYRILPLPEGKSRPVAEPPSPRRVEQAQTQMRDATLAWLEDEGDDEPSPPHLINPDPSAVRKRQPSRRCPKDWEPTDQHRRMAEDEGIDFERELAKFRDYEFAAAKVDWDATFRNWLRAARGKSGEYRDTNRKHNAAREVLDFYRQETTV